MDWSFQWPSPWVLIDFLERLPELGETYYLLDYWSFIKRFNSGAARRKRCIGQGRGKGWVTSMFFPKGASLSKYLSVHQPRRFPNPIHVGLYGSFVTKTWLIKSLVIAVWFNLQPRSPLPRDQGVNLQVPTFQLQGCFSWHQVPSLSDLEGRPIVTSLT